MKPRDVLFRLAVNQGGEITKKQAMEAIGHWYYYNAEKYVGEVLSRMVNAGILERVKPGHFKVKRSSPVKLLDPNQQKLF